MRKLFPFLPICAIILWWIGIMPKGDNISITSAHVYVNPMVPTMSDTFVVETASWVFPMIIEHSVTVTVYHAVEGQTDSTPDILADGTKIDLSKAGLYRYCALSRNLLERWDGPYSYGDTIYLKGAGKFSGPWIVKDTMNSRFINRMDLLVDLGTRNYKFDVATIRKLSM